MFDIFLVIVNPTDHGRQLVNHVQVRFLTDVKRVEPDIVAELKNVRSSVRNSILTSCMRPYYVKIIQTFGSADALDLKVQTIVNKSMDALSLILLPKKFRDNFLKLYSHSNSTRAK